jgi:hypothetical protein
MVEEEGVMTPKEIAELVDLLRSKGVTRYETTDLKLELGAVPVKAQRREPDRDRIIAKRKDRRDRLMFAHVEGYNAD